jgi:hypothetical protein
MHMTFSRPLNVSAPTLRLNVAGGCACMCMCGCMGNLIPRDTF